MSVSENIICTSAYNSLGCSFPLLGSYTGNEREVTPLSTKKSLSRVKANTKLFGSTCCLSVALVTRKHKYFPGICDATGSSAIIPPTPGLCFHKNSMFLYSLLKSAASAVLKLTSAVIAIAHLHSVSMKSLSVMTILFEKWFGRSKYDSKSCPKDVLLALLPSVSSSPVFLADFNFFIIRFLVWVSPTPTPRTKSIHRSPHRSLNV